MMGYGNIKGISGIGTLIIFIALIITSAVAAIVLLGTAESLQSQATSTGKQSEKQVSSQLLITQVIGIIKNTTTINKFRIVLRPAPGSSNIYLKNTFLTFSDGSTIRTGIIFDDPLDDTPYENIQSSVDTNANDTNEFTVYWFGKPTNYNLRDSVKPDEMIEIYYYSGDITGNTNILIEIMPSIGAPSMAEFRLPTSFDGNNIQLFP